MLVYYGLARGADSKATAISSATRAIELEPSSSPGHASLAFAVLLFDQDRERAGREFERAIDLNPRYVQGRCWYALFYLQWTRGRFAEGVAHARRALEDDPLSAYPALMLSGCLQATGPLDEAIATGRLAVERDPRLGCRALGAGGDTGPRGKGGPRGDDVPVGGRLERKPRRAQRAGVRVRASRPNGGRGRRV
jgi:tetratricopeptide (TPR) repeat protein